MAARRKKPAQPGPARKVRQGRVFESDNGRARGAHKPGDEPLTAQPGEVAHLRELFWHNVVREMLTGLMVVAESRPELLDGRFAILTKGGERIPIAQVAPVFGFSANGDRAEREASAVVQMTVFRIATPDGEVYTLPVTEVRGFHELTPELIARLQQAEKDAEAAAAPSPGEPARDAPPFGLAAFTALPKLPPTPAPMHPME